VRKLSGYRRPSQRNAAAFEAAVDEVAGATRRLLDELTVSSPRQGSMHRPAALVDRRSRSDLDR